MDQAKIEGYLAQNAANLPADKATLIKDALAKLNDDQFVSIQSVALKNPTTVLLVALFLGAYGIDRFMLGQTGLGIAKLLTCGGAGIWCIIDWFSAKDRCKEYNFNKLKEALAAQGIA